MKGWNLHVFGIVPRNRHRGHREADVESDECSGSESDHSVLWAASPPWLGGDPFAALQVDSDVWETSKGPHGTDTLEMTCGVSDWGAIHLRHRERDEREAGQSGSRSGG